MNAVAQVFVDAYEKDRDLTPKELIDAGWTYHDLSVYMYCCEVIRSIGIAWGKMWMNGSKDAEIIRKYFYSRLESISEQLTTLIGEEIHVDLSLAKFFDSSYFGFAGGHFQIGYLRSYDSNSSECFGCLLRNDEYAFSTISFFIGKYIVKGVMIEFSWIEDIPDFSVAEANDKIKVLEHKLFTLDEPYFDEDENLKDFSSIHKYGKQIAKYIQDEEELDSEISELNDYVSDPKKYIRDKKLVKIYSQLDIKSDLYRKEGVPSSACLSVILGNKNENHEIFLISDAHEKSDTNFWIHRGFSQTILATLMQGLRDFEYKGEKHHICEATILSDAAIDILGDDTFRNPNKITTVYVYSHKHISNIEQNYTPVTAYVLCANRNMPVPFNVYYDKQGDRYFINETSYLEYAKQYGFPLMKLKTYAPNSTSFSMADLSDMSTLRLYGYTVSKNEGLTDGQRQELLKNLMDSRLMSKTDILNHIEWLVNTHEGNYKYADACDKWMSDIRFVNQYRLDTQRSVWAKFISNG